jgi:hypothetical protein
MNHETDVIETSEESQAVLAEGYRQMAADRDQEALAEEWTEALIGDVADSGEETFE